MIAPPPTALRALAVIAVSLVACDGVEAVRCEGLCVADAATDAMGDVSTSDAPRAAQDATATDAPTADVTATDVTATDATSTDVGVSDGTAGAPDASTATRLVVSAAWLADAMARDPTLQVIDVRDYASYLSGHIARAIHFDASTLAATVNGVPSEVVDAAMVSSLLGRAGVRSGVTTVIYGDSTTTTPTRAVWTLHHYGNDDVHLLDGGMTAWRAEGRAVETASVTPAPATYATTAGRDMIDAAGVLARLGMSGVHLVDARAASEYAAGHIPGARNVDWASTVTGGSFRSDAELLALFAGIPTDAPVIAYCQSGARGSVVWVALRNLGFSRAVLYDGSWAEWSARAYPHEP